MAAVVAVLGLCAIILNIQSILLFLQSGGRVEDGLLPGVEAGEHIDSVPHGEIRYLINKNVYFKNYHSKGNIMLENPESSEYDLKIIIMTEDGKTIYTSPELKPGQYLESDKLSSVVKPGVYACDYYACAYANGEYCGEVTGTLNITVSNASGVDLQFQLQFVVQ